jgi:hypothetical protein
MTIKVKPLEWRPEPPYHVARVFGNVYAVEAWDGGATLSGVGGRRDFNTLSEAKAAAQADYEARILSALAPQAGDNAEEQVAWLVKIYSIDGALLDTRLEFVKPTVWSTALTEFVPLYTHPCTSTPVVSQNAPALEDKGGDGWQPIETAPKDRPILLDFSYYYDTDRTPTIIYAVGEYVQSDNDYVWDSGDEVHHKDAPRAWMDIPKTNIQREPGFDGKRLKLRRPSR